MYVFTHTYLTGESLHTINIVNNKKMFHENFRTLVSAAKYGSFWAPSTILCCIKGQWALTFILLGERKLQGPMSDQKLGPPE